MPREADRVAEISTTTGTGAFTLVGPASGFRAFSAAFANGTEVHYSIVHDTNNSWEVGRGIISGGVLLRDQVYASSTGGGKIWFAAGNKIVFSAEPAEAPDRIVIRAPANIGLEITPASGQTGNLIRTYLAGGSTPAFWVAASGNASCRSLTVQPVSTVNGTVIAEFGGSEPWQFRSREVATGEYDMELLSTVVGRSLRVATSTAASGFRINPGGRAIQLYGAGTDALEFHADDGAGIYFFTHLNGSALDARLQVRGNTASFAETIMTREKGDNRYQMSPSLSALKREITPMWHEPARTMRLEPKVWKEWLLEGHPRQGLPGAGFVHEDVAEHFPEAASPEGTLDAFALLAGFVHEFRTRIAVLEASIEALESP